MNLIALVGAAAGLVVAAGAGLALPARATPASPRVAWMTALLAAAMSMGFRVQPIGSTVADRVVTALFVAVVVAAVTRASITTVTVASAVVAGAALAGAASSPRAAIVLASVPFGVAVALRLAGENTFVRVALGPVFALGLLSLPTSLPSRAPSVLAGVAAVAVMVSGWHALAPRPRRGVAGLVLAVTALAAAGAGAGAVVVERARPHAERAITLAEGALGSAESLQTSDASTGLQRASVELSATLDALRSPLAVPARALPVVGRNLRAIETLATHARTLSTRAGRLAGRVDLSALRPQNARIDLARYRALEPDVAALKAPIASLSDVRDQVDADPWVVGPVKERVGRFDTRIAKLGRQVETIDDALRFVPPLFGGSGERRYLLVFPTPSEARGSGGLVGNFGEFVAKDGHVELTRFGRNQDLQENGVPLAQRVVEAPKDYLARYAPFGVATTWSNMNMTPDFPSAAEAMANQYPQSGGARVDGVISADPEALAAFLELLGPLQVPSWPEPLTSANASEILLNTSYVALGDKFHERVGLLADVATGVWSKLAAAELPDPARVGQVLAPAGRARHLQLWMRNPEEQAYLGRLGVTGAVAPINGDSFGVVVNNAGANKIDWYLHRSTTYSVVYDPKAGTASVEATVTFRNLAPADGLPDYVIGNVVKDITLPKGSNRMYVSVYSALPIVSWDVDGTALAFDRQRELGRLVSSGWIAIAPESTVTMTIKLAGAVPTRTAGAYRLELFHQPLIWGEDTTVRLRSTAGPLTPVLGWSGPPARVLETTGTASGTVTVEARAH